MEVGDFKGKGATARIGKALTNQFSDHGVASECEPLRGAVVGSG
jgi:hypothetical protein